MMKDKPTNEELLIENEILRKELSEKNNAELALKESEVLLSTIVEGSLDAIVAVDDMGLIVVFNGQAQDLFQYSEKEVLNQRVEILMNEEVRDKHHNRLKRYLHKDIGQCGHIGKRDEKKFRRKDGSFFIAEVSMSGGRKGQFRLLILSINDITKRKKAENDLIKVNNELKDLNKTKDKLFSIIAHDLRNPFCAIQGFTDLLNNNIRKYNIEKTIKFVEIINNSAKNAITLLNNLLDWAKSQTGQLDFNPRICNLNSVIQKVIDESKLQANIKNILINNFQSNTKEIYADLNMLEIILRNLISNAIKYTNEKGEIDIYSITMSDYIEITISDNGVGIDELHMSKLFNRDTCLVTEGTANEKGTGLGLLLCQDFVNKHGGEIRVESELNKGSNFKFTLPFKKS
ncbi:MAG: PAS domain-containing sensor histidine kinase [Bacteroidales bacterium]|nr:PAS domain-containing sensor histidine kinase [Bacteroidales bacterium]